MKKMIFAFMVLFGILVNTVSYASETFVENQMNVAIKYIAPYVIENGIEPVTRGDCIATIMKMLGVNIETANHYANAVYDQPVYSDLEIFDEKTGYIIISKFCNVSCGVQRSEYDTIGDFQSERIISVKECLTFMLRCLKKSDSVIFDNVPDDSVSMGLLEEIEAKDCDKPLQNTQFYTLLCRMLNMNRYLYWSTEQPLAGVAKETKTDQGGSIRYIDWIYECICL